MRIQASFNSAAIQRRFEMYLQSVEEAIYNRFVLVGETFIRNARENGNYNDVTGNLRSSIGYIILKDGLLASESFPGDDSEAGKKEGKNLATKIAKEYESFTGFVLIVVAGMEYASAVESRGKDVLTASGIEAVADLRKAMDGIKSKVSKKVAYFRKLK